MWKSPLPAFGEAPDPIPGGPQAAAGGLEYRPESDHPSPVENTRALSARRDMFLDERGTGLRVTWHPERDLVVLSVWQDDSCVGTFRMPVQDIPRLSGLLAAALGDWVDQTGLTPSDSGVPGSGGGPGSGVGSGSGVGTGARGGSGTAGRERREHGAGGSQPGMGGAVYGLSMQQRLRLSRPVLKLRGLQDRRRRPA
jgi:hypothetical protein